MSDFDDYDVAQRVLAAEIEWDSNIHCGYHAQVLENAIALLGLSRQYVTAALNDEGANMAIVKLTEMAFMYDDSINELHAFLKSEACECSCNLNEMRTEETT